MLQIKRKGSSKRPQWLVESSYVFGSDEKELQKIEIAGQTGQFAKLEIEGDVLTLLNLANDGLVSANGKTVLQSVKLKAKDSFVIGAVEFEVSDPKEDRKNAAPKADEPKGWYLKALNTALANKTYELEGVNVLGRSQDNDICLSVVHLSRHHARLTVSESGLKVEDLDSSNGTFLNGKKVNSSNLKPGDELTFDTLKFKVYGPQAHKDLGATITHQEEEMTTMRPAIQPVAPAIKTDVDKAKHLAEVKQKNREKAAQEQEKMNAVKTSSPTDSAEKSGRYLAIVFGILIGAATIWFILQ